MNTRVMCMLMACGMASIGMVPLSNADILSDLLANPPQAPYVDRQGEAARTRENPVPTRGRAPYQEVRPQSRTVMITPENAQQQSRSAAGQALRALTGPSRANVANGPLTSRALASSLRPASAPQTATRTRVESRPGTRNGHATQQTRPRRIQHALTTPYTPPSQTVYAPRYPQQPTYAVGPNYYQGYSYQGWGATNSASSCGPGRA